MLRQTLIAVTVTLAPASALGQAPERQPVLIERIMAPSLNPIAERLDLYDDALTNQCDAGDRQWEAGAPEDQSERMRPYIEQGALPEGTTLAVTGWTASGCGQDNRQYRSETISIPGFEGELGQVGAAGQTRIAPGYIVDYFQQIASVAGFWAQQAGCASPESLNWLLIMDTQLNGPIDIATYIEERGPDTPPAEVDEAWSETWTIRYCEGQANDINVLVGHDVEGGIGVVFRVR